MDDLLKLVKMYDARGRQINKLQRVLNRKNRRIQRQHQELKDLRVIVNETFNLDNPGPGPAMGPTPPAKNLDDYRDAVFDPGLALVSGRDYWSALRRQEGNTLPGSGIQHLDTEQNAYDEVTTSVVGPDAD